MRDFINYAIGSDNFKKEEKDKYMVLVGDEYISSDNLTMEIYFERFIIDLEDMEQEIDNHVGEVTIYKYVTNPKSEYRDEDDIYIEIIPVKLFFDGIMYYYVCVSEHVPTPKNYYSRIYKDFNKAKEYFDSLV